MEGREVGEEGVVPRDEFREGEDAWVGGGRGGRVKREVRELGVEDGDGVDELDEAESQRVEVWQGTIVRCPWCAWGGWGAVASRVGVEGREGGLHDDGGAGETFGADALAGGGGSWGRSAGVSWPSETRDVGGASNDPRRGEPAQGGP